MMAFLMLFLLLYGGAKSLGIYAAITAITAPISMFCVFRYIESIALSQSKSKSFLTSLSAAIMLYIVMAPPIFYLIRDNIGDYFSAFILFLFKPLEMIHDFYIVYLSSEKLYKKAILSMSAKFIVFLVICVLGFFYLHWSVIHVVCLALFLSYFSILLILDIPYIRKVKIEHVGLLDIHRYVIENVRHGIANAMISINSVMPRYFFMFVGDLKMLGIFTFIYQMSATCVNVIQYPMSIRANDISNFIFKKYYFVNGFFKISLIFVLLYIFSLNYILHNGDDKLILFFLLFIFISFVMMLLRGALFSSLIAIKKDKVMNKYIFLSGVFSLICVVIFKYSILSYDVLSIACIYVVLSVSISSMLALRKLVN